MVGFAKLQKIKEKIPKFKNKSKEKKKMNTLQIVLLSG
jgi:hypothetical protein